VLSEMRFVTFLFGREIPSFFILEMRLVLGSPSRTAAPSGPPITHLVASNVRKIIKRVQSLNVTDEELWVVAFRGSPGAPANVGGIGLGSTSSFDRMTALSMRFWSSRTFPGQEYEMNAAIVSGGISRIDLRMRLEKASTKWETNNGTSSDRSLNGGS